MNSVLLGFLGFFMGRTRLYWVFAGFDMVRTGLHRVKDGKETKEERYGQSGHSGLAVGAGRAGRAGLQLRCQTR